MIVFRASGLLAHAYGFSSSDFTFSAVTSMMAPLWKSQLKIEIGKNNMPSAAARTRWIIMAGLGLSRRMRKRVNRLCCLKSKRKVNIKLPVLGDLSFGNMVYATLGVVNSIKKGVMTTILKARRRVIA